MANAYSAGPASRRGPLDHLKLKPAPGPPVSETPLAIGERGFIGKLILHGPCGNDAFERTVADVAGVHPPREPNTCAAGAIRALWLTPGQWLLVTAPGDEQTLARTLKDALETYHTAVVDVSEQHAVITLAGDAVHDVLAKGCALTLHSPTMAPGRCARTHLARLPVIIDQRDARPTVDVFVERTVATFLWRWLERAAREWNPVIFNPAVQSR